LQGNRFQGIDDPNALGTQKGPQPFDLENIRSGHLLNWANGAELRRQLEAGHVILAAPFMGRLGRLSIEMAIGKSPDTHAELSRMRTALMANAEGEPSHG